MSEDPKPRRALASSLAVTNRTYDALLWAVKYFLPGLGTLYFSVAGLWGLPYAEQVVGTIVAVTLFLSAMLGISKANYKSDPNNFDGVVHIDERKEDADYWTFEPTQALVDLAGKKELLFKVNRSQ